MREDGNPRDARPDRTLAFALGWILLGSAYAGASPSPGGRAVTPADSPEGGPIVGLFQAVLSPDAPAPLLLPCGQAGVTPDDEGDRLCVERTDDPGFTGRPEWQTQAEGSALLESGSELEPGLAAPPRTKRYPLLCNALREDLPFAPLDRFTGCAFTYHRLVHYKVENGVRTELGRASVRIYEWNELKRNSRRWTHYIDIRNAVADGTLVSGLLVKSGKHDCTLPQTSLKCRQLSTALPGWVNAPLGVSQVVSFDFESNFAPDTVYQETQSSLIYGYPGVPDQPEIPIPKMKTIRCDNRREFAAEMPNGGCVYSNGYLVLYHTPSQNIPEVSQHIKDAQNRLIGNPGRFPNVGSPLHRLTEHYNFPLWEANQKRTLVNRECAKQPPPTPGQECDEYPFASTWEGGSGANPPGNFHVRYVNGSQNSRAGSILRFFYRDCRMFDGFYIPNTIPLMDPFYVATDPPARTVKPIELCPQY